MSPMHRFGLCFLPVVLLGTLTACNSGPTTRATPTQAPLSTQAPIATPDPSLATPPPALAEEPLQGQVVEIPSIFIVPARQSKAALATHLKTTPEQLDWANPGLPDPIAPGALVVIPPYYRTAGETPSQVSQRTGLPEELLRAANPQIGEDGELAAGALLLAPPIYIVPDDMSLSSVAAALKTNDEALLSANPALADQTGVAAGTVLVAPLSAREGE